MGGKGKGGKGKVAEAKKAEEIISDDDVQQLNQSDTEQEPTPVKIATDKPKKEEKADKANKKENKKKEETSGDEAPADDKEKKQRKPRQKKERDPNKPKREPSAYNLFIKQAMPQLKADNLKKPEDERLSQRELMTLAAAQWQAQKSA